MNNSSNQFTSTLHLLHTWYLNVQFLEYSLDVTASVSKDVKCISLNETEMKEACPGGPQGQGLQIIGIFYFDSKYISR